jgi:hypothetical protein
MALSMEHDFEHGAFFKNNIYMLWATHVNLFCVIRYWASLCDIH